jgi:hypothetical protein
MSDWPHNLPDYDGVWLKDVPVGKRLSVITKHHVFTIEHRQDGFYIQGHEKYCPVFTPVVISGSTWGGSSLKMKFVGFNMHMEFYPESYEGGQKRIVTSAILDVKVLDAPPPDVA